MCLHTSFEGFPGVSAGTESACNAGYLGSIPGLGRSPGEGKGYPFQCSGLENSMDCIVHGVSESDTTEQLSLSEGPRKLLQDKRVRAKGVVKLVARPVPLASLPLWR